MLNVDQEFIQREISDKLNNGHSLRNISQQAGVSVGTIQNLLRGGIELRQSTLERINRYLKIDRSRQNEAFIEAENAARDDVIAKFIKMPSLVPFVYPLSAGAVEVLLKLAKDVLLTNTPLTRCLTENIRTAHYYHECHKILSSAYIKTQNKIERLGIVDQKPSAPSETKK